MLAELPVALPRAQPMAEGLAALIRDRIASGFYAPGTWLRESALAQETGYSNGPIREALQTLVTEELLVREPWRGVRVVQLDGAEIVEIFQLRLALLELAAELTAARGAWEGADEAREWVQQMQEALAGDDLATQVRLGALVTQALCEASGNRRLAQGWRGLTYLTRMYIHASLRKSESHGRVVADWRTVVEAVASGNAARSREAVRTLVRGMVQDLHLEPGF